jgi:DNA-binding SARP family transcriptional activator/tetratricopeptide (TPR) repeat protein
MLAVMDFLLLGQLEVYRGRDRVEVGRRRERCLLGLLLLEAGRAVRLDRLVDLLWDDDPPANARASIHAHISRLRAVLDPQRDGRYGVRLLPDGGGYRGDVDPGQVDAHRFGALVVEARQQLDPEERVPLLREALGLWRGPLLADDASDALRERIGVGLEEQRLDALEACLDAELGRGRHREVVPELAELVDAHPMRERLVGTLMRALHGSGRGAEALLVYERHRRLLAAELGSDPGPELRRLHLDLLRGAVPVPASAQPPSAAPAAAQPVRPAPAQLPAEAPGFVGRTAELAELDRMVAGQAPAVAIVGAAGTGKTALAVQWARAAAARYPDGQLYVDLRGFDGAPPLRPSLVLDRFLRTLDVPRARILTDPEELAAEYRSAVAGLRVLIVLDNAASAEQVRPLLPGDGPATVLVTSRLRLDGLAATHGVPRLTLGPLPPVDALALIRRYLPGHEAPAEVAERLARLCDHLPLALRILAARLDGATGGEALALADALADERGRLDRIAVDDGRLSVRAAMATSERALADPERRVFRLLGLHPDGTPGLPAVAALTGLTPEAARPLLDRLGAAHLVEPAGPDRYAQHDLVHLYARERCAAVEDEPARDAATRRLLVLYRDAANTADRVLRPAERPNFASETQPLEFADEAAALAWFDAEAANLFAVVEHAATRYPALAWQIGAAMYGWLFRRHHRAQWIALYRIAAEAAARAGDPAGEALILGRLGVAHGVLGQAPEAVAACLRAHELRTAQGDLLGAATALINMVATLLVVGRPEEAIPWLDKAGAIARELPEAGHLRTIVRSNLAMAHAQAGRLAQAAEHYREALGLARVACGTRDIAQILIDASQVHHRLGEHRQATAYCRRGLHLARQTGDVMLTAEAHRVLGRTRAALGDPVLAGEYLREALATFERLGHAETRQLRTELADLQVAGSGAHHHFDDVFQLPT